ncbi:MAG: alpha/beta hydrolase [Ruminococcaceae bacterium]|nr:alpha/beta hydrolase [Oscillospiraceae bacterium]
MKNKRKILIISISIVAALAIIFGACAIYLGDYYRADEGAIAVFTPEDNVSVSTIDGGNVVFEPQNATVGFIFYPGGKVEANAYQPLLAELAREGVLCVLVEMPFNLAVFDINAADGIQEQYPHIEDWYIGGHSLGGSMAASYLADHVDEYEGLILLGSYSTADLSDTDLDVLSIFGSEDKVLNREKYDENKSNLPDGFCEVVIEGGCHAYFGMYGAQDGDGTPTISNHEQIRLTVESIIKVLK